MGVLNLKSSKYFLYTNIGWKHKCMQLVMLHNNLEIYWLHYGLLQKWSHHLELHSKFSPTLKGPFQNTKST